MTWLHHNVTLSDVVAAHKSWCFGIILPSLCWTHQPLTPENLLQLDFFHQHFHLCAHMARLKQTEFICFKPGFGKFLCLVWNVSCYDLNRLCLVFTSSKYLRLNPGSEVFSSQLPARTITILSICFSLCITSSSASATQQTWEMLLSDPLYALKTSVSSKMYFSKIPKFLLLETMRSSGFQLTSLLMTP